MMLLYRNRRTMSVVIVFIFQLLLMTVTAEVEEDTVEELRQLHILFRHGDRTPTAFFGDDPYASFDYPEGVGGLTLAGKERLHRVGAALRAHFQAKLEFLPPRNIEAQSSPKRRVVESALALLAGFAPPKSAQEIWSNKSDLGSRWQPVAVQTASPGRAWLLGEGGCPEVDRLIPLAHSLPLTVETWDAAMEFRTRLTSSMNVTFPLWSDLATLYDTVICEQEYFSRLGQWAEPAWIQGAGPRTMEQLAVFRRLQFTVYGLLPMEYKRLQAGPFLKEVIAKMKSPSSEDEGGAEEGGPQKKVFLYGTHDTVMAPILHVLGVFQGQPSFGSGLVLELLASSKSQNRTTTVRMSFFNVTADDVRFSELPFNSSKTFSEKCSQGDCDLGSVEESLRQYLPVDIELECGLKSGNEDSRNSSRTTVLLLVVALVLAIAGNVGLLSAQCCSSSASPKRSGYQAM